MLQITFINRKHNKIAANSYGYIFTQPLTYQIVFSSKGLLLEKDRQNIPELHNICCIPSAILVLRDVCCTYNTWPVGGSVWQDALESIVVVFMQLQHQNSCIHKKIAFKQLPPVVTTINERVLMSLFLLHSLELKQHTPCACVCVCMCVLKSDTEYHFALKTNNENRFQGSKEYFFFIKKLHYTQYIKSSI